MDRAQDSFWHIFFAHSLGDCSQREKLSEIKPPSAHTNQAQSYQINIIATLWEVVMDLLW